MAAVLPHCEELMQGSRLTTLPSDIVIDILLRLPAKALIRFKCVCKPWCTLFGNPKFIKMHLNRAITKNDGCLLLKHLSKSGEEIYSLRSNETFDEVGKLKVPVPSMTKYYQIVECSHGLICLTESNFLGSYLSLKTCLWNPTIREFRVLPKVTDNINRFSHPHIVVALGFAYHPKINDYKVVRFVYFFGSQMHVVNVYSLSTDSWREINTNIEGQILSDLSRAFVNGALHWMASEPDEKNNSHDLILSFDMGEDKINRMVLPNFGYDESQVQQSLAIFRGSLSVLIYNPYQLNENCDIWVMKDYGVVESWIKQFTIQQAVEFMIPLGFFDDGKFIVVKNDAELVLCDLNVPGKKNLQVLGPACIVKYTESLVSPKGGGNRFVEHINFYEAVYSPCFSQKETG